jgi:hypothetical protein
MLVNNGCCIVLHRPDGGVSGGRLWVSVEKEVLLFVDENAPLISKGIHVIGYLFSL